MKPAKNEPRMSNDVRIAVLETSITNINSTLLSLKQDLNRGFDKIDKRFDVIDKRFEVIDNKFEGKFERLESRMWSNFLWLTGMIVGLAGLIAHTQHWI